VHQRPGGSIPPANFIPAREIPMQRAGSTPAAGKGGRCVKDRWHVPGGGKRREHGDGLPIEGLVMSIKVAQKRSLQPE